MSALSDPRSYWVTRIRTKASPHWELTGYAYQDETESGGKHNIYVTVLDEHGAPMSGVPVWQEWPDDRVSQLTIGGVTDFGVWGGPFYPEEGQVGAYSVYVEDKDLSDVVAGMGLPVNRHVCYYLTFQWRADAVVNPPDEPPPPPIEEEEVMTIPAFASFLRNIAASLNEVADRAVAK